jgi:hypothetical protein
MRASTVTRLTIVVLAAWFLAVASHQSALSGVAVRCLYPGEWPHTADGAWTARVIAASGFKRIGCTGSALVIDTGGRGRSGHDLSVWAFRGKTLPRYGPRVATIEGVRILYDSRRAVWHAQARNVWIAAGPSTLKLLPLKELRALIRASTTTR